LRQAGLITSDHQEVLGVLGRRFGELYRASVLLTLLLCQIQGRVKHEILKVKRLRFELQIA
jgi:hypothetical protein